MQVSCISPKYSSEQIFCMFKGRSFQVPIDVSDRQETINVIKKNGGKVVGTMALADITLCGPNSVSFLSKYFNIQRNPMGIKQQWVFDSMNSGKILPEKEYRMKPATRPRAGGFTPEEDAKLLKHYVECQCKESLSTTWKSLADICPRYIYA